MFASVFSRPGVAKGAALVSLGSLGLTRSEGQGVAVEKSAKQNVKKLREEFRIKTLRRELLCFRADEVEMRKRWERDEVENFRRLPARAWPAYQPSSEEVPGIQSDMEENNCTEFDVESKKTGTITHKCAKIAFDLGVALVFNNIDVDSGLHIFSKLGNAGYADGMVAMGIVLVEGFGVEQKEEEGVQWLIRACEAGNPQGFYEYGTALYGGLDDVLEEDEEKAFYYFKKASEHNHVGAQFMAADCMLEGIGVKNESMEELENNIKEAIPLLSSAAEQGHRYARQRMRELLDESKQKL